MYENFVLLGDFNRFRANSNLKNFLRSFNLTSLIGSPTCHKSINNNSTYINLILNNKINHFMKSTTFKTGLSAQHKLTITVLGKTIIKINFKKFSSKIIGDLTKRNLKMS